MNIKEFKSFNRKALVLATLSVATLASCTKDEISQDVSTRQETPFMEGKPTGEYIVVMKDGSESAPIAKNLAYPAKLKMVENLGKAILTEHKISGIRLDENNTFATIANGFTAKLNAQQLAELKKDNRIAYIEEDKWVALGNGKGKKTTTTTTTEEITEVTSEETSSSETIVEEVTEVITNSTQVVCWGVAKVGGAGDGTGKTAWIIDSGIDPNHSDLNVDKTQSKSFLDYSQAGNISSYADEYGHGTEVAGILGAKDNGFGAVGVAAGANLVSLRVIDANGYALTSRIIRALNWVATYGKPGDVVNYSIGGGISTTIDDAVRKVAAKGIYVSIASGNSAADCINNSPQRVDATNVFTVSAMDNQNVFANFSNFGSPVDYSVPGVGIYTTARGGGYTTVSGTSYAAPHMAGILLLTAGKPKVAGYVAGDKDGKADPIASK